TTMNGGVKSFGYCKMIETFLGDPMTTRPNKNLKSASAVRFPPLMYSAATKKANEQGLNFSDYIRELVLRDLLEVYNNDEADQDAA
ncbi:hypothetical protein, partial [Synechococcus sp. 7002]